MKKLLWAVPAVALLAVVVVVVRIIGDREAIPDEIFAFPRAVPDHLPDGDEDYDAVGA